MADGPRTSDDCMALRERCQGLIFGKMEELHHRVINRVDALGEKVDALGEKVVALDRTSAVLQERTTRSPGDTTVSPRVENRQENNAVVTAIIVAVVSAVLTSAILGGIISYNTNRQNHRPAAPVGEPR